MTWLEPATAMAAWELYKSLVDQEAAASRLRRLTTWLLKGETQIAVLGAGGTGKSTFEQVVTAENPLFADTTYRSDWTTEPVRLPGDISAKLLVAPEQERYVQTEWQAIFDTLERARSLAVINVVSYGHQAFKLDSIKETEGYAPGQSVEQWRAAYCDHWRAREIEMLRVVAEGLREVQRPVWMLTVVAKQDLWWTERPSVIRHYTDAATSAYAQIIAGIETDFAARGIGFSHHALGVSQVHENFTTREEGIVIPVAEGYSLSRHLESLYNLTDRFRELLERGAPPALRSPDG